MISLLTRGNPTGKSIPKEVRTFIDELTSDAKIVGECPSCGESSPLSDWNLFYADHYPETVKDVVDSIKETPAEAKLEYEKLKLKLTKLAAERSLAVNVGLVIEEIAPGLPTFPFNGGDSRTLLKPIDYLIFDGLSETGKVKELHFAELKTGASRLNDNQKMVKGAVESHKVEYGQF